MYISLDWLKDFIQVPRGITPEKIGELLTMHTAEVEDVTRLDKNLDKIVTGKLVDFTKIKGSDKLHKGIIDLGKRKIQVVFGSVFRVYPGWIMPIALPGAKLALGEITKGTYSGIKSEGMICSDKELGLEYSLSGLTIFPENTPLGKPVADVLGLHDVSIEIENKSLTHRPDLWGHYGIARELAAIWNQKLKPIAPKATFPKKNEPGFTIQIKDLKGCPRFTAAVMKNIEVKESPKWLKSRLLAVGYRPINNIVDITNYVMAELGQPSHAFDADLIKKGLIIRPAKPGEKMTTLDGQAYELEKGMLLVCDHDKPVSLAGIMGGENSEINTNTNTVIIEAANWEPYSLRKTATKLGIRTEAAQRFEKSLDPALTELTVKRICELIKQLCPKAEIITPLIDVKTWKFTPPKLKLSVKTAQSVIGLPVPKTRMISILKSLKFDVKNGKTSDEINVTVPSFRATKDVSIPADLIEEIARIYGYDNIDPILPDLPTKVPIDNLERRLKHRARQILSSSLGFNEVYNYSFYSKGDLKKAFLNEKKHLKLDNYLSEDQTHLRVSLLPNLLKKTAENLRHFDEFKIYEVSRTYQETGAYMPKEEKMITGLIVQPLKSKQEVFYQAKGALEAFLKEFRSPAWEFKPMTKPPEHVHPAKSADLYVKGKKIGTVYELNPAVANNFDLKNAIGVFEINFTALAKLGQTLTELKPLPKFPGLSFDVSVVLPKNKTVTEIQSVMQKTAPDLIENIKLFDIFEDKSLGQDAAGQPLKSLAFHLHLQAADRTLTDEEMTLVQQKIFSTLQKLGGKIRGL